MTTRWVDIKDKKRSPGHIAALDREVAETLRADDDSPWPFLAGMLYGIAVGGLIVALAYSFVESPKCEPAGDHPAPSVREWLQRQGESRLARSI